MEAQSLPRTGRPFLTRSPRVLAAFGDERLIDQLRSGNEAAFEVIYDRHHRGILSFCRHMLASVEEAEDAVQQTFISAYDALRSDAREIRLKPWLYAIARNRCLSTLRARREQSAELDDIPTSGLSDEVQQRADLRELLEDMRELPVDQRAALVLSELGDLSHAEIGDIVGCGSVKVKSLVFQARSSLIESRNARAIPCSEIREQLATATGGALRRRSLRRHLSTCEGCREFRDGLRHQRKALAAVLPVIPSLGLKESALAAIGIGGGSGGAGMAAGGGLGSLFGGGGLVKAVAVVAAAGAVAGGAVVITDDESPRAQAADGQRPDHAVPGSGHAVAVDNAPKAKDDKAAHGNRGAGREHAGGPAARTHGNPGRSHPHRSGPGKGGRRHPAAGNPTHGLTMQPAPGATPSAPSSGGSGGSGRGHAYGHEGNRGHHGQPNPLPATPNYGEGNPDAPAYGYGHGEDDVNHDGKHEDRRSDAPGDDGSNGRPVPLPRIPPLPHA